MKASRNIIISVLTLVLTVTALVTVTVAWFSLSTVSQVSNISGSVRGGEGLEVRLVSLDGTKSTSWKSNLSPDDVNAFVLSLNEDFEFNAVSTTDGLTFTKMAQIDEKTVVNGANALVNEDYMKFKIQFKSPTAGKVTFDEYELTGTGTIFTPEVPYDQAGTGTDGNTPIKVDPSNGARFSLSGTIGTAALKAYQKAGIAYEVDGSGNIIGNLANNDPVVQGQYSFLTESKGMQLYYNDGSVNTLLEGAFGGVTMFSASEGVDTNIGLVLNNKAVLEDPEDLHIADVGAEEFVSELEIIIWLEGWDADTYDALYLGVLNLNLIFSKED